MHNRKVLSLSTKQISDAYMGNSLGMFFLNQEHMYDNKAQTETGKFSISSKNISIAKTGNPCEINQLILRKSMYIRRHWLGPVRVIRNNTLLLKKQQ